MDINKMEEYCKEYRRNPLKSFEIAHGMKFNIFQKIYWFFYYYWIIKKTIRRNK